MNPYIFVHIPKTAGTSLRASLDDIYSSDALLRDYGPESGETSELIKRFIYRDKDNFALSGNDFQGIYGHFPAKRYLNLSACDRVVSVVREPIARVISEYKHFQRVENFQGSLEEFARDKKNRQHAFLAGMPWCAFGFIGVSERYQETLELLSAWLGKDIREKKLNVAPKKKKELEVSEQELALLTKLNAKDLELYQQVTEQFDWRVNLFRNQQPFTNGGWRFNPERSTITGFAYSDNSDQMSAVPVRISINGKSSETVLANRYHAVMHKYRAPRMGHIGFTRPGSCSPHDDIQVTHAETGQPLVRLD